LSRKSQAPPRIAATAFSTSPKAVISSTGSCGLAGADFAQQLQAVHRLHAQVGDDQVEVPRARSPSAAGPPPTPVTRWCAISRVKHTASRSARRPRRRGC
jgi:hypothetical protein